MRRFRGEKRARHEPARPVQVPAVCRGRRAELGAGACQSHRTLPGTPAGSSRNRSRGCVSATEARARGQRVHDADPGQTRALPGPENRRHAQPDAVGVADFGTGNPRSMNSRELPPGDADEETLALIATLHQTEQRLEELTAGEVDTVANRDGQTVLLRRAQEHMRHSEAAKQAAILNALPAHIALLDVRGVIISVNEAWRRFAGANAIQGAGYGIGLDYLEICDGARGDGAAEAHQVAEGIRSVLAG